MEGLTSGFELGLRLNGAEEIKAELKRLKRMKEHEKVVAHFLPFGTILAIMSLPLYVDGNGLLIGYCTIWQKVRSQDDTGFQCFLDRVEYSHKSISQYERKYGPGFVSIGGLGMLILRLLNIS
ncbi:hypothetical protein JHK85_001366 [Glycine max]|nr:hypothetical protein JHK85_001366 [Glycine max]